MALFKYFGKYLFLPSFRKVRYVSSVVNVQPDGVARSFQVGSVVSGFQVKNVKIIPEFQLSVINLQHIGTGAEYLHFDRNDSNNVFCIGFKTTPLNSTGVSHVLEHTVLCGSEIYPCRDPFFKMINRSLSTFMNAMTGSDYTIYPFSTQHPIDFKNLMSVYLDSVFNPKLLELDFLQEGWRLEHEDPDDQSSPLVLKGVVFNEMKGVFADCQNLFLQKLQNGLFPSHTYGYVSGGDPCEIPNLSWKDLKEFHAKHYHPSNCRFFTYGNFSLESHLQFINENYLSKFQKIYPNTKVPNEPRWNAYKRAHIHCSFDAMIAKDRQSSVAVSYMLTNIQDTSENFILSVLSELLMNGPNSPFYKSLIESNYGTNFTVGSGFDGHTCDTSFTIGIQGVEDAKIDSVIIVIEETFDQSIAEGFPEEQIEGVLHDIELGIKHQTANFGLKLIMSLTPLWNHQGDPIEALKINQKIDLFRKNIKNDPKFLQSKLEKYFKNNKHKFILSMSPNTNHEFIQLNAEKSLLQSKINALTNQDRVSIWDKGQLLKFKQEEKEELSCLPTLHVSDISRYAIPTLIQDLKLPGNIPLQICAQPTNGVTYFKLILIIKDLPEYLRPFVPLFCGALTEMGAGDLDFRSLSQKIGLFSGGFSANIHVTEHPQNIGSYEEGIILSSHCLQSNLEPMLDLWIKILNEIKLDDLSRFATLVKMYANEKANGLIHSGHNYAMSYASSSINFVSYLKEQWGGITHIQMLKHLSEANDLTDSLDKVKEIAARLLQNCTFRVAVNTLAETNEDVTDKVAKFVYKINYKERSEQFMSAVPSTFCPQTCSTHLVFPFPVNFASKAFTCLPYSHPDCGSMRVLARLMFKFLHKEIREKGGAYGGGAVYSPGTPFSFYSYRDPHSTKTLITFDNAVDWVLRGSFTPQDVNEAKLGVFQSVDSPISPGSKGLKQFLYHVSDEMFNEHRLSILDTEAQDVIRVCRAHLRETKFVGSCLIGPQNESLESNPLWIRYNHD